MFWDPDSTLRFHVMEKSTGKFLPNKYEADPMGFYHVFNAYEEEGCVVLDAPFKPSPTSYDVFTVAELAAEPAALRDYMARRGPAAGLARRWVLPLAVPATFTPPAQADRAAMFDTLISL